ncbi:MAG: peptidyl-prolyl cis-trans isomerase [Gammaproteobacteria bacterium]|nr:peptidyl-prolyl cis-trans isomerase [Gammaproteobacteria bacterium]
MKASALMAACLLLIVSAFGAVAAEPVRVLMVTSKGNIELVLDAENAPITVGNFLAYVDDGYYDGTIFHRVIENFMIQGGGLTGDMQKKDTRDPIENEAKNGLKNRRGTIAMARTGAPHSATSQFFINHQDNANLDYPSFDGWGYAVFGEVTDGMDVVDTIAQVPTGMRDGRTDVPREPVTIISVSRVE